MSGWADLDDGRLRASGVAVWAVQFAALAAFAVMVARRVW